MFHVVNHAKQGGDSQLVDVIKLGQTLKKEHPDVYKILTETEIEYGDNGATEFYPFAMLTRHPIIE